MIRGCPRPQSLAALRQESTTQVWSVRPAEGRLGRKIPPLHTPLPEVTTVHIQNAERFDNFDHIFPLLILQWSPAAAAVPVAVGDSTIVPAVLRTAPIFARPFVSHLSPESDLTDTMANFAISPEIISG